MEPPSQRQITVLNETPRRIRPAILKRAVGVALDQHGIEHGELCVLLTSDERIQDLNRTYRGIDEPTDVLTFPSDDSEQSRILGDIAISVPYATRQAGARGVSLDQELAFLAIHGALHIAGFDDETEPERAHMVSEMNRA